MAFEKHRFEMWFRRQLSTGRCNKLVLHGAGRDVPLLLPDKLRSQGEVEEVIGSTSNEIEKMARADVDYVICAMTEFATLSIAHFEFHPFLLQAPGEIQSIAESGKYSIVYADPAWSYNDGGCNGAAQKQYDVMNFEEIASLPIKDITTQDSVLFLWATFPKLAEALSLMPRWGFAYKSIAFLWLKTYKSGIPFFGLGRWTRGNAEPCFLGVKGNPHRISAGVSQLIEAPEETLVSPIGRHSAKPAIVRERIVELMGKNTRKVELFARSSAAGWDSWGNEVKNSIKL